MCQLLDTCIQVKPSEVISDFEDSGLIQLIVKFGKGVIDKLLAGIKNDPEVVAGKSRRRGRSPGRFPAFVPGKLPLRRDGKHAQPPEAREQRDSNRQEGQTGQGQGGHEGKTTRGGIRKSVVS